MKILALIITIFFPVNVWACSCIDSTDVFAYQTHKSVMLVKITSTRLVKEGENEIVQANFNVVEAFKGKRGDTELIQSTTGWTCSSPLVSGYTYLIYSSGEKIKKIDNCSMSRAINPSREKELLDKYRVRM